MLIFIIFFVLKEVENGTFTNFIIDKHKNILLRRTKSYKVPKKPYSFQFIILMYSHLQKRFHSPLLRLKKLLKHYAVWNRLVQRQYRFLLNHP